MDYTNTIYQSAGPDGAMEYIVSIGSLIYNGRIVDLSNLVIPIAGQSFFDLPAEKGMYAVVNVYYGVEDGRWQFDTVTKDVHYPSFRSYRAIGNMMPIGQFIILESFGKFQVMGVKEYSRDATYVVSTVFETGSQGFQGPMGETGPIGQTGVRGHTGFEGYGGFTGLQGDTGVGYTGYGGVTGCSAPQQDRGLVTHLRYKLDDDQVLDYSVYAKDFFWTGVQGGFTAMCYTGGQGETGYDYIVLPPSIRTSESGVIDNCDHVVYAGSPFSYRRDEFINLVGFTGTISAWVRLENPPVASFGWTGVGSNFLAVRFTDTSTFRPSTWQWQFGDGSTSTLNNPTHTYGTTGVQIVTLRAINKAGYSERYEQILV
jgi:hypothetical protein